ncbi:hypothetical protein HY229_07630 [Candidatus Acetothermia bacterium]|nr:hypothetical protein [Candidatus Acetothermia bacterium]MBI3643948.1 hypothetical protein [Candidatus Acetothermia bacterium]
MDYKIVLIFLTLLLAIGIGGLWLRISLRNYTNRTDLKQRKAVFSFSQKTFLIGSGIMFLVSLFYTAWVFLQVSQVETAIHFSAMEFLSIITLFWVVTLALLVGAKGGPKALWGAIIESSHDLGFLLALVLLIFGQVLIASMVHEFVFLGVT